MRILFTVFVLTTAFTALFSCATSQKCSNLQDFRNLRRSLAKAKFPTGRDARDSQRILSPMLSTFVRRSCPALLRTRRKDAYRGVVSPFRKFCGGRRRSYNEFVNATRESFRAALKLRIKDKTCEAAGFGPFNPFDFATPCPPGVFEDDCSSGGFPPGHNPGFPPGNPPSGGGGSPPCNCQCKCSAGCSAGGSICTAALSFFTTPPLAAAICGGSQAICVLICYAAC